MVNFFQDQILIDTNKRTVTKHVGLLDGSAQETANAKVIGLSLRGALAVDSNNAITVANGGTPKVNYRANVARIIYDVNIPNGYLKIDFSGATPATIVAGSGKFDMNFQENMGVAGNPYSGATGNIVFTTVNAAASCSYTVWFDIHKNGLDYEQGQVGSNGAQPRPNDFNFGQFATRP